MRQLDNRGTHSALRKGTQMRQAYFAVAVNSDGSMYLDHDISVNYDENPIWNEQTEKWEDISEHETFYDEAADQLAKLLETTKADN